MFVNKHLFFFFEGLYMVWAKCHAWNEQTVIVYVTGQRSSAALLSTTYDAALLRWWQSVITWHLHEAERAV